MKHLILAVSAIVLAGSNRSVRADETAIVVLAAPNSNGTSLNLLNRVLPAGVQVKVQVPVPGSDPTNGTLLVWPALGDKQCKRLPEADATQRHETGLAAAGQGDGRVLEATIPPLQLATRYCIRVTFDRRLSTEILNSLAEVVAATPIAWRAACRRGDREAYVAGELAKQLEHQLASYGPKVTLSRDRVTQAATTIAKIFRLDAHCAQIARALAHLDELAAQHKKAAARLEATKHDQLCIPKLPGATSIPACTRPPTRVFAWPSAVSKAGNGHQVTALADALTSKDLSALAVVLAGANPAVASELQALAAITASDPRASALESLKARFAVKPPAAQPLALFLPSLDHYVDLGRLYDAHPTGEPTIVARQAFADLLKNLSASSTVVIEQLPRMRRDDPRAADAWIRLLTALRDANQDAIETEWLVTQGENAVDTVVASLAKDLAQVVQTDTVKDLLRQTASDPVVQSSSKAPATDEKGSWVSPNLGVLAAVPIVESRGTRGILTGWFEPYAGASIYFTRIDRVIDLHDLVGATFWQRNSLTVGFLLSRPSVNGRDVRGPWSLGAVPVIGFGHRVTQYFRVDIGAIPFTYADVNPVILDSHRGIAFWIGGSLDADIWAAVSGKLGK